MTERSPVFRARGPVFYDAQRRRWRRTRRIMEVSGAVFALLLIAFAASIFRKPDLPEFILRETRPALHALHEKPPPKPPVVRKGRQKRVAAIGNPSPILPANLPANYDPLQAAFYVPWDSTSLASLRANYTHVDLLIPEALHSVSPNGKVDVEKDDKLRDWLQTTGTRMVTMPLVNNYDGKVWRVSEMTEMLRHPAARQRLVRELVGYVVGTRQAGLVVDFEEVPAATQADFRSLIHEMAAVFHLSPLKLMVCLPAGDPSYDYAYMASQADAIILMDYDQHWTTSPPGPIAGQEWFQRNMTEVLKLVPPEKLIVAIANYAYDWRVPKRKPPVYQALSISFQQAIVTALESEAKVEFDADSLNPYFSYSDENNLVHRVWLMDGVTGYNQVRAAERARVRGTALWRLGSEDPSIWSIIEANRSNDARAKLGEVPAGYDLVLEGNGDIWRIMGTPQNGRRVFRRDESTDTITGEEFLSYPLPYRIDQIGAANDKIALTFDDGPDPRYTGDILDILKEKKVTATFFVTGIVATNYPRLLERIYREGHEVGNHSYTHPRFNDISRRQLELELNLTERLLESSLGIKTIFFRPPYGVDHQPESADEVALLPIPQSLGYVIIGSKIDPHDWGQPGGGAPPSAETIVSRVLEQAKGEKGNIVLLHDGGGDRSSTVAALPEVIDRLRSSDFDLVPVSTLLGMTRAQTMPPLNRGERWTARIDAFMFSFVHGLRLSIAWIFIAGIALVSGRALIIGLLALIERITEEHNVEASKNFHPLVSVLVPAYNEEEVIESTVSAALASDYPHLEIVVVDDGSTDRTAAIVEKLGETLCAQDARVRLHRQVNRGKPAALTQALSMANGEIVVTIDADTAVEPSAVSKLVRHFVHPRVAAVAGNVKVANRDRWLTRWQALEYVTSQNLEKRAFGLLNCITVVPGAVSAWRPEIIRDCGGFSADTVAEDADLTLAIRRRGWRILYDDEAIAFTQAPDTAAALIRQRFRWTFGTLQAAWKHRDTLFRPRHGTLGWIALPNVLLFQLLLPLVSPLIDLLFLGSLALWGLAQLSITHFPPLWTTDDLERSVIFFLIFMFIDFATCIVAFALENKEEWSLLEPLLLQRFYYRQMMYWVIFRSVLRAVQGHAVGWMGVETRVPSSQF